jgi:hypothetical protein
MRALSPTIDDMKRKCAYCGCNGPLTKEHIVPAFLSRLFPYINTGIPPRSKHVAKFEGTMRDVCPNCNSGPLSDLDAYAQSFIEQNKLHRTFPLKRPSILVTYDYERLLRWLLKVSYNAMRAEDRDLEAISKCKGFILGSESVPYHPEIFVEVIRNMPISDRARHKLPASIKNAESLTAHRFRLGTFGFPGSETTSVCRFVAINAFYFYLMLLPSTLRSEERDQIFLGFRKSVRYALRLRADRKAVYVKVSKNTLDDVYREQFLREWPAWKEYFAGTSMDDL